MSGPPLHNVTLAVVRVTGDLDLQVASGDAPIFTTNAWESPQQVTVFAAPDADGEDGQAILEITGHLVEPASVTAQEVDDDPGIVASPSGLAVPEGGQATFTVALNRAPNAPVTVAVSRMEGDADLAVAGPALFFFDPADWASAQTVTVTAAQDEDSVPDAALLRCSADAIIARDVTVVEQEDDHLLLRVDFGLTNAPVETDGDWREFALPSSTAVRTTNRAYAVGSTTVTVTLASSASLNGRDRASPAADAGGLTYASVYRDLVQSTSGGNITLTIAGLRASWPYDVRTWIYDYGNANNAVFTNRDLTAGRDVLLGRITNTYATAPSEDNAYTVTGVVTSDPAGVMVLLVAAPSASTAARLNGLQVEDADPLFAHGVPGSWLIGHGLTVDQASARGDADGDGAPTGEEYIAGTDPTNSASALRVSAAWPDPGHFVLHWPAASGRLYAVLWNSNQVSGIPLQLGGDTTAGSYTDAAPNADARYYHVRARRAP